MDFDAAPVPVDVVAALGLAQDVLYSGQNVSGTATLYVRESATVPAVTDRAFRVESGGQFSLRPRGAPIWFGTDEGDGCAAILTESP